MLFKELSEIGKKIIHQLDEELKVYKEKESSFEEKIKKKLEENFLKKESPESKDNETK